MKRVLYFFLFIIAGITVVLGILLFTPKALTGNVVNEQKTECNFLRGDADSNEKVELTDAVRILGFLFQGKQEPSCLDAADTNDNGKIDISDAISLLQYLFLGGSSPGLPYPARGIDPTADGLGCFGGVTDATCAIKRAKDLCGFGIVSEPCICGGVSITEGRCCLGSIQSGDEPCKVQVYAQMKSTESGLDSDLFACSVALKNGKFAGCGPYETIDNKESQLTSSTAEQRNPSYYNHESYAIVAWEESEKDGQDARKRKVYLCYLNEKVKNPGDCEKQKVFVAEGYNPSVSRYLVWEDKTGVWACDPLLKGGPYSCVLGNQKTVVTVKKDEDKEEIWTPLIKEHYVLYRDKSLETAGKMYDLYACDLGKESLVEYCNAYRVGSGKIDLPQLGDISNDGKSIVYAVKNARSRYDIFAVVERGKNVVVATGQSLVASPQVVFLRNNELRQKGYEDRGYYVVWKDAVPGNKYNIHVKLLRAEDSPLPPLEYKVITPGYTGANGQPVFDQLGFTFVQDKIAGKFEGSSLAPENQNFINQWFTCDLKSLERTTPDEIQGGIMEGCLKKEVVGK